MRIALAIILALALAGCATTFETDRDRVVIFGFGFTAALVSNKTTKAASDKSEKSTAPEVIRAAAEREKSEGDE